MKSMELDHTSSTSLSGCDGDNGSDGGNATTSSKVIIAVNTEAGIGYFVDG